MNAGLYGLFAAIGWGGSDYIARFTGRAIGHRLALFGITSVGVFALSISVYFFDLPLIWQSDGIWLLLISGIGITWSTLLLYKALARGPVTIIAPIVGSFPVVNVVLAIILGARPDLFQWAAILSVLAGVWSVSYGSEHFLLHPDYNKKHLRYTIMLSLCASVGFGISVAASQSATQYFGELQTICLSRWIGLTALSLYLFSRRQSFAPMLHCWPLLILQGLMDTSGYVALMLAANTDNAELAVVASSGFCVITVTLARIFLKEMMSRMQWLGVFFIVTGVAYLSATT